MPGSVFRRALLPVSDPQVLSSARGADRVGWGFISLYTVAYMSTALLFLAPLLVTLALKVDSLVGLSRAPASLALVAGVGALVAMAGNPLFGRMSDRTASKLGMRRPWMLIGLAGGSAGILIVALAPSVPVVLAGWCIAELFFNALLAAMVAVLPDQVPSVQRGQVSGVLGVCSPIGSVCGAFVVKLFTPSLLVMFLTPCAIGGFFVLLFAVTLNDRRLDRADKPAAGPVSPSAHASAGPSHGGPGRHSPRSDGDVLAGRRRGGRIDFGGDRGRPEALHGQPYAQ